LGKTPRLEPGSKVTIPSRALEAALIGLTQLPDVAQNFRSSGMTQFRSSHRAPETSILAVLFQPGTNFKRQGDGNKTSNQEFS
jgi:hypothetical protein